jgi:hypothetical protein
MTKRQRRTEWNLYAPSWGFKKEDFGHMFMVDDDIYIIDGCYPRNPVWAIRVLDVRRGQYVKMRLTLALRGCGRLN